MTDAVNKVPTPSLKRFLGDYVAVETSATAFRTNEMKGEKLLVTALAQLFLFGEELRK